MSHSKDERGYVTIAYVVPLLLFCDEIKILLNFEPVIFLHIHSFSSLSYDRSKASSKASSPHSAI